LTPVDLRRFPRDDCAPLLDDRFGGPRTRALAMIVHVAFEVSDLARSARFYDAIFYALGARRMFENDGAVAYGHDHEQFWIVARGRGPAPEYGHVALAASGRAAVDGAHAAGLANGGSDDGAPGPRPRYGTRYYAGYLRDPDGLRVELAAGAR
jgi:catechol 2,3-dioxygenase-like lactoylglutathione lyase family enzyme